jgi:uncharacterized small protein (TIGR04563 family)
VGSPGRRKQSLYFPEQMLEEMRVEAERLDRSLSWIVQKAWRTARIQIAAMPSANDAAPADRDPAAASS